MDDFDQLAAPGYPVFLGSEFQHPTQDSAFFHVVPVPFEASVSYGNGTGMGPRSILEASWQLEQWDGYSVPGDEGIYTHTPIDCDGTATEVMARIASLVQGIVQRNQLPVGIGGEHTVTYGMIRGFLDAGFKDFGVVQIDAHADLRERYEGNLFSHASVMKRIVDENIPLLQLGVRALCQEEIEIRKTHGVHYHDARDLVPNSVTHIDLPEDFPDKVFFTIDVDGMDPAIFPSTGTPVPGGLGWYQTLSLFESVAQQTQIIGFDVTEFSPIQGFHGYQFSAASLIYQMMGIVLRNNNRNKE